MASPSNTPSSTTLEAGSPSRPSPFGEYQLLGLIARGGMAEVYRAVRASEPTQLAAIKCMRPGLAAEERFVKMFLREGELARLLHHDNIVRTLEVGRSQGRYFIAMEYISGRDLTQLLRRCQERSQRIPVPHAIYVAAQVARGLHYAHTLTDAEGRDLHIVNRDVSASNVRLSFDGDVKILDFGIAQAVLEHTSEIGVLKGKLSYMSPEQIRGMPLDARTDIFSTGILLHEMLTTEKLFRSDSEFDLMEKVRSAEVPPPSRFNRRVKPPLDDIVLRALAHQRSDRFQTGAALADALEETLTSYDFQPFELTDFMRRMFAAEHAREQEALATCLALQPPGPTPEPEAGAGVEPASSRRRPPPMTPDRLAVWVILVAAVAIATTALILLVLRGL